MRLFSRKQFSTTRSIKSCTTPSLLPVFSTELTALYCVMCYNDTVVIGGVHVTRS
jgi:hypothetical protein